MPTKPSKSISPIDAMRIYYSQGAISSAAWASQFGIKASVIKDIRRCKTQRQVTIQSLSPEDQDILRAFLIDIRNLDLVQSSHKAAIDDKTKQVIAAFLAYQQFEFGGVEFRYQNKQLTGQVFPTVQPSSSSSSPQLDHKVIAVDKSTEDQSTVIASLKQKANAINSAVAQLSTANTPKVPPCGLPPVV